MRGKKLVEQVDRDGNITEDYDVSITPNELFKKMKEFFPEIHKNSEGMICGEYLGKRYAIRAKNITYLGNPHPIYKKRIQIPEDLPQFYQKAIEREMKPILLGVYTYGENTLFCEFSIEDFIGKKAHNSSAHVYTSDMAGAVEDGVFQKVDCFGNRITVFKPEYASAFLEDLFEAGFEAGKEEQGILGFQTVIEDQETDSLSGYEENLKQIVDCIEDFFVTEDKVWRGVECYQKMVKDNYRNKFQSEWAGFFLEYEFESYLKEKRLEDLVRYEQDKTSGGIDLDLYFPAIKCYGDLKAHSENSRGIQGNDWDTVMSIIDSDKNNHIFYIVCEHSTVKDSECGYEVTQYWNKMLGKEDLMSYSSRMKNRVELKKFYVLDINASNKKYLTMFKQGVNSNKKLRPPKIMIEHNYLDKFVIAKKELL